MSWSRITKTLSTAESMIVSGLFLMAHVWAYIDREKEYDENLRDDYFNFTFLSQMLATGHTLATMVKILDNYKRAGYEKVQGNFKCVTGTMVLGSVGTLAAAWASSHSEASLVCSIANAGCNFFGKLSSAVHRNATLHASTIDFDSVKNDFLDPEEPSPSYHAFPDNTQIPRATL